MVTLKSEIQRYLGYGRTEPDHIVSREIDIALNEIQNAVSPKSTYKILPLSVEGENISFGSISTKSKNLAKNLTDCKEIVVFGATLGVGVDTIITKYGKINMARAVIMQACAAAIIEEYCDKCQEEIAEGLAERGLYLRPRFSPGYGDFGIENQIEFINILESPKKIGLSLTASSMLVPTKSVTAVMGVTSSKEKCNIKGCEECDKTDCLFRRDG